MKWKDKVRETIRFKAKEELKEENILMCKVVERAMSVEDLKMKLRKLSRSTLAMRKCRKK